MQYIKKYDDFYDFLVGIFKFTFKYLFITYIYWNKNKIGQYQDTALYIYTVLFIYFAFFFYLSNEKIASKIGHIALS